MGVEFVVLGIENQQHIHYAMPLRHMIYDAMGYLKDTRNYKKIRCENRQILMNFYRKCEKKTGCSRFFRL